MHTELGRSQVEVQRCALSWRRVGKAEVAVEVDADMVEEKLEEEARRRRGEEEEEDGEEEEGINSDKI